MRNLRVLIVGSDFNDIGSLKTQGQYLSGLFNKFNIKTTIASKHRNYLARIMDTFVSLMMLPKPSPVIVQVYSTLSIYLEFTTVLFARLLGHTVISTLHGGNIPNVYRQNKSKRWMLNLIFKYSNIITAPSKFILKELPILMDCNKCHEVNNMIDLSEYHFHHLSPDKTIRILWMRSYHAVYDPMLAVQSVEWLLKQGHLVEMIMAGSDLGLKSSIETYIHNHNLEKNITLYGVIGAEEKNKLASLSNVYLSTNSIDNAPVTFLEMMAMGLPVVTTNVGGIPYYVTHGLNALLASKNTPDEIGKAILSISSQVAFTHELVKGGLQFVKSYGEHAVFEQWVKLFQTKGFFVVKPLTS